MLDTCVCISYLARSKRNGAFEPSVADLVQHKPTEDSDMSAIYEELKAKVHEIEEDVKKFYEKENKAAGTRIRKAMQDVKKLAQAVRTDIQEKKANM